ncbi:MAG: ABC transporter permease, partial [Candidatus Rokubacteria bacterium]|nr:ABC transporter permease [Candidatus Rokubacteria bacterium]
MLATLKRFAVLQPLGVAGGLLVLALVLTAVLAPQLAPHGAKEAAFAPYQPPSA